MTQEKTSLIKQTSRANSNFNRRLQTVAARHNRICTIAASTVSLTEGIVFELLSLLPAAVIVASKSEEAAKNPNPAYK